MLFRYSYIELNGFQSSFYHAFSYGVSFPSPTQYLSSSSQPQDSPSRIFVNHLTLNNPKIVIAHSNSNASPMLALEHDGKLFSTAAIADDSHHDSHPGMKNMICMRYECHVMYVNMYILLYGYSVVRMIVHVYELIFLIYALNKFSRRNKSRSAWRCRARDA